jgi:hypothetical protein
VHEDRDVPTVELGQRNVGRVSTRMTRSVAPVQCLEVITGRVVTQLLRAQNAKNVVFDLFGGGSSVRQPKGGRRLRRQ